MNEENDTGKHEFNFFLDKEIQQKLLEADEEIAAKEAALFKNQVANSKVQLTPNPSSSLVHSNSSNAAGTFKSSLSKPVKDSLRANISGWCSGPGVIYRKSESDLPLRSRGQQSLRDALPRDSKFRPQTHNPQDFVFRHYADPRRYIEQYRKEHSCYDTTTTSATRGEFLDTRRFYAYNQYSPLAVPTQNNAPPLNNPLPSPYQDLPQSTSEQTIYNQKKLLQQSQAPTLQYTNRREQTKQTISANLRPSNLQKFSRSNTTNLESKAKTSEHLQESNVTLDHEDHVKRVGSARGSASPGINGLSLQRNPTPSDLERLSARGQRTPSKGIPADSNSSNQFSGRKLGQVPSSHTRTLDALASQAPIGGKQRVVESRLRALTKDFFSQIVSPNLSLVFIDKCFEFFSFGRGAVAHLVEELATKSEVRGSKNSPGQIILSLLLLVHPALNGQLGLLRPGESKGGEESNGKLPRNAICQNNQDLSLGFPMLGLSVASTLLSFAAVSIVLWLKDHETEPVARQDLYGGFDGAMVSGFALKYLKDFPVEVRSRSEEGEKVRDHLEVDRLSVA
ncbi:hypothetical protein PoB_007210100 [Plakobranchus ocellatus]|uniref:Uncharacterized protein n=1 Tax=Plakobranchus ocellatus TaxID=259542 RepID=A0AAV4DNT9_9GAST|nr:hypothetical protein PoB_007210100 [Plakobranchus ocellatus]